MGVDFGVELFDDDTSWFEISCRDRGVTGHRPSVHVTYDQAVQAWSARLDDDEIDADCCEFTAVVDPSLTDRRVRLNVVAGRELLYLLGIDDSGFAGLLTADDLEARAVLARAFAPTGELPPVFYRGELGATLVEHSRSANVLTSALDELDALIGFARKLDRNIVWNR